jgi:hypothetical protein
VFTLWRVFDRTTTREAQLSQATFAPPIESSTVSANVVISPIAKCGIPCRAILDPVQKTRLKAPRQLCNSLLHKFPVRPRLGESPHVFHDCAD